MFCPMPSAAEDGKFCEPWESGSGLMFRASWEIMGWLGYANGSADGNIMAERSVRPPSVNGG